VEVAPSSRAACVGHSASRALCSRHPPCCRTGRQREAWRGHETAGCVRGRLLSFENSQCHLLTLLQVGGGGGGGVKPEPLNRKSLQ